jgi:pimeloyl-ACP methyl ester carboxylesterase
VTGGDAGIELYAVEGAQFAGRSISLQLMKAIERTLELRDGRRLRYYDTGPDATEELLPVVWHHGTPNIGLPPEPLFPAAERLGIRWIGYDRPGYGGSTRRLDRDVASAAADVGAIMDGLGIDRFAVMGHSGGGPHALACACLLPDRVSAAVLGSSLAPFDADGLDYFDGMIASGIAALAMAAEGRDAKTRFETSGAEYDPEFTPADLAALEGPWRWFGSVVGPALAGGPDAAIDDDLAYVAPWGFDPADARCPVLLIHGGRDGIAPPAHGRWLAGHIPDAELRLYPDDGHVSVMTHAEDALAWLAAEARR